MSMQPEVSPVREITYAQAINEALREEMRRDADVRWCKALASGRDRSPEARLGEGLEQSNGWPLRDVQAEARVCWARVKRAARAGESGWK